MTNRELTVALSKHRGPVYMGTIARGDVVAIQIVKVDLVYFLQDAPQDDPAPFEISHYETLPNGKTAMHIDAAQEDF